MNSCVLLVRRRTRIRYRAPESDRSLPIRPSVMRTQSPERIDRRLLCTWTALTGPSAVSSPEDRSRILPIEERDVRHRDVLRAHGLTLVLVRAGPEVLLLHLLNHGLAAAGNGSFPRAPRQQRGGVSSPSCRCVW